MILKTSSSHFFYYDFGSSPRKNRLASESAAGLELRSHPKEIKCNGDKFAKTNSSIFDPIATLDENN